MKEDQQISYTITVTNEGPADVVGAVVTDEFPKELENVTWTAEIQGGGTAALEGTGDINESVDLENGSSIVYTVSANLVGSLTPNQSVERFLSNSVSVLAPADLLEVNLSDNRDSDSDIIVLKATTGTAQFSANGEGIQEGFERVDALGDLDGDGDLDAVIRTGDNWAAIVLNDGFGSFSAPIASFEYIDTVALGDMDNDGDLDLVFSAFPRAIIPVWLNNGSAQFTPLVTQDSIKDYALEINLADFNGDGYLDVLYTDGGRSPGVYLNDGTGAISHLENSRLSVGPVSLGDVDGDGDIDVLSSVSNFISAHDFRQATLHLNDGNGVLSESSQSFGSIHNRVAELGDVDGDGDLDAFVLSRSNTLPEGHRVWLNDGFGEFADSGQTLLYEGDSDPLSASLKLGDFDGDGDLDAIISSRQRFPSSSNQVWLNDGQGSYSFSSEETSTRSFTSYAKFALGDLDGDGDLDLIDQYARGGEPIFLNGTPIDLAVSLHNEATYYSEGSIVEYVIEVSNLSEADAYGARIEDYFDTNLLTDIRLDNVSAQGDVVSQYSSGPLNGPLVDVVDMPAGSSITYEISARLVESLSPNQGSERFLSNSVRVIEPQPFEDLDLTNNVAAESDLIFLAAANGAARFTQGWQPPFGTFPFSTPTVIAAGDLDGDQDLDVLVRSNIGASVLINDGSGQFTPGAELSLLQGFVSQHASLGDLDNDGDLDVLLIPNSAFARVWLNNGDGTFTDHQLITVRVANGGELGDIDGDGDLDLVVARAENRYSEVLVNTGNGTFGSRQIFPFDGSAVRLGDVDADGDLDVWLGDGFGRDRLLFNDGRGNFTADAGSLPDLESTAAELADFDADGDLDLVTSAGHILKNDGFGQFSETGQRVDTRGVPADLDGDGDQDILSLSAGTLWLNDGNGSFFQHYTGVQDSRLCCQPVVGDFDSDGDLDFFGRSAIVWLNESRSQSADFNRDKQINGQDFLAWQRGYGLANPEATKTDGDADNDFDVDAEDLAVWLASYAGTEAPVITSVISDELQAVNTTGLLIDAALALSWPDDSTKVESDFVEDQTFVALKPKSQFVSTARGLEDDPEHEVDPESASSSETDRHDQSWLAEELLERVFS